MRPFYATGAALIVLGFLVLFVRIVNYVPFAGPMEFFEWDMERPLTILTSPLAGLAALTIGVVLMMVRSRSVA